MAIDVTSAFIEEDINHPPIVPVIEGPLNGKIGQENTYYITNIIEPDGDNLYIFWDWGDETDSYWDGVYNSGEQVRKKTYLV